MSRIKSTGSKIERTLGTALWASGIRYRKQYKKLTGKPDFVIVSAKVAVFCDSAFWHGYGWPEAACKIKSNREFWIPKIERNIARDEIVNESLAKLEWIVLRFWDHEILKNTAACVDKVVYVVGQRLSQRSVGRKAVAL
jgi:DNA mismatch endonuclease Vsr